MIKIITDTNSKADIVKEILNALPEWFGVESYVNDYVEACKTLPVFAAFIGDTPIGFIALKPTSKVTAEIHCMGILKSYQNQGYGKALYKAFEAYSIAHGYKFIQVKTVKEGHYKVYDKTIRFYQALGFHELEVFPTLWDAHNPCQVFVKPI